MRQIGQRVKLVYAADRLRDSLAQAFNGHTGTIIENTEKDGSVILYRVRLDEPADVPGVGMVHDDIWTGAFLRPVKPEKIYEVVTENSRRNHKQIGTLPELINYFSYTLEVGASWDKKVQRQPKTFNSFLSSLQRAYAAKEAACYDRTMITGNIWDQEAAEKAHYGENK